MAEDAWRCSWRGRGRQGELREERDEVLPILCLGLAGQVDDAGAVDSDESQRTVGAGEEGGQRVGGGGGDHSRSRGLHGGEQEKEEKSGCSDEGEVEEAAVVTAVAVSRTTAAASTEPCGGEGDERAWHGLQ